ncbi:hypothetical protein [Enterobacter cancerogenus]
MASIHTALQLLTPRWPCPSVAEKVFHITATQEYRFTFALSSVKPARPELELPSAHVDIGGGYLSVVTDNVFLTRLGTQTVPLSQPDTETRLYRKTLRNWTA